MCEAPAATHGSWNRRGALLAPRSCRRCGGAAARAARLSLRPRVKASIKVSVMLTRATCAGPAKIVRAKEPSVNVVKIYNKKND